MDFTAFKTAFMKEGVVHFPSSAIQNPRVSICVVTYQHAQYIEQCLESLLSQQTSYKFEILVAEDSSDDGTRDICVKYAERHPETIRLLLHNRSNNINIGGRPTGRFNFTYNLYEARGKYITLCDGDDYWTDPLKLQKQVDALENNEDAVICFHNVGLLKDGKIEHDFRTREVPEITDIYDLANGNFIHTPSVMFRNIISEFPQEFFKCPVGDFMLYLLLAKHGKIIKLPDEMAMYRYQSNETSWTNASGDYRSQRWIVMYYYLARVLAPHPVSKLFYNKYENHLRFWVKKHIKNSAQGLARTLIEDVYKELNKSKDSDYDELQHFIGHYKLSS